MPVEQYRAELPGCEELPLAETRESFLRKAAELLPRPGAHGLMLIDIDHMARINAAWGRPAGSQVIGTVAQRLRRCVGGAALLGRLRGNCFGVVWPGGAAGLERMAQRMLACVAMPVTLDSGMISVSVSIGIAAGPRDGSNIFELLRHTDLPLQRAKHNGGGRYEVFSQRLLEQARQQDEMNARLHLAAEHEQFSLAYQPIMRHDGSVAGAEALLRWSQEGERQLSPAACVEQLERNGLIHRVGRWILHSACGQAADWHRAGHPDLQVHVNLSPSQLMAPDFVDQVMGALSRHALPPAMLQLEVTENLLISHADGAIARLRELAALGVGLWIDDFGTGYSSLSYLKLLPVTGLKIDRSFITGLPADARDRAMVAAIAQMAALLKMQVIIEGIETAAQADCVRALGPSQLQGFFYGRGIAAAQFEQRWLAPAQPIPTLQ